MVTNQHHDISNSKKFSEYQLEALETKEIESQGSYNPLRSPEQNGFSMDGSFRFRFSIPWFALATLVTILAAKFL